MPIGPSPSAQPPASKSNFYYSFLFLPKDQREAIHHVYNFCRMIDDIVDADHPLAEKQREMDRWRKEIARCFDGQSEIPEMRSLRGSIESFGLSPEYFEDIIQGVEMDLTIRRYETFKDLSRYCYGVAGAVGLLCLQIFGVSVEKYREYAISLGTGFQLTNILRDLKADAKQDRIYLPLEELQRFGYSEEDLLSNIYNKSFVNLMKFQCDRASSLYHRARSLILPEDRRRLVAAEIMSSIYAAILEKIAAVEYDIYQKAITISSYRKLLMGLRIWILPSTPSMNPIA